ncbi:SAM-dependent methyltransferase [Nocardia alni]|uniref:SAM-dependent methyltransferase n=1 Tax=Nocardia alni TaxID=2815723 RepID=UPI001C230626|nr:SAM-dependent methyltransferase [Nocardia alni]
MSGTPDGSYMPEKLPYWAGDGIDPTVPSLARMYDYSLGGGNNFAVDRELAEAYQKRWPHMFHAARSNRAFLRRVVGYLLDQGVRQFLDIGSGIPTAGNVHEVIIDAGAANDVQLIYVDIDPIALIMSHRLLTDVGWAHAVRGDASNIDGILTDPEVTERLDFTRPVAVLMLLMLHAVPGPAQSLLAGLPERLSVGSYLAVSNSAPSDSYPPDELAEWLAMGARTVTPTVARTSAEIAAFFDGFELVEPGLVPLPLWRPEPGQETTSFWYDAVGGVSVKL